MSTCVNFREVAKMMTDGMEIKEIITSTVIEAEYFANNGFKDILIAHFITDETKINR